MAKKFRYQHITSSIDGKKPLASKILKGEIAVNDFAGNEALYIKNTEDEIIGFATVDMVAQTLDGFFDGVLYDASGKTIDFYHGEEIVAQLDATEFVKDGMVDNVEVKEISGTTYLAITFNTDAGKEEIDIPITDIFDASNYYTKAETSGKTEISNALAEKLDVTAYTPSVELWEEGTGENSIVAKNGGNIATGSHAIAEGIGASALTQASHAEGSGTTASGLHSHAEGDFSVASGWDSHAEGSGTTASGSYGSHAEGRLTTASGETSHAEGNQTIAGGNYSHAEGNFTITNNECEHASGQFNISTKESGQFGGENNTLFSVGNGYKNTGVEVKHNAFEIKQNGDIYIADPSSSAEYFQKPMIKLQDELKSLDNGKFDDAQYDSSAKTINFYSNSVVVASIDARPFIKDGMVNDVKIENGNLVITFNTDAGKQDISIPLSDIFDPSNYYTKQEVDTRDLWVSGSSQNSALLKGSNGCTASGQCAISIGSGNNVTGDGSMAVGDGGNTINGGNSFAFGAGNNISGNNSTAIGVGNRVNSDASFAFGGGNISSGTASIAMGSGTTSTGSYSFTEGVNTVATGWGAHAEGSGSTATGDWGAHAEGRETQAIGAASHTEGDVTIANNYAEHASGQFNISSQASMGFGDSGNTLFSVGNGYGTGREHNAFEIRQNGDIYISDPSSTADFYEKPMIRLDFDDFVLQKYYDEDQAVIAGALNDLQTQKVSKTELDEAEAIIAASLNDLDTKKVSKTELDEVEAIIAGSLNDLNEKKVSKSELDEAEAIIAASLNDLNEKKVSKEELEEEEAIIAAALNDLDERKANVTEFNTLNSSAFTYVEYDSQTKELIFKNITNDTVLELDATPFIKDGMVDDVEIKEIEDPQDTGSTITVLAITFNTDAGKEEIDIPLTDIFDASNYYTKTEVDELFDTLNVDEWNSTYTIVNNNASGWSNANDKSLTDVSAYINGDGEIVVNLTTLDNSHLSGATSEAVYTRGEVDDAISAATSDMATKTDDLDGIKLKKITQSAYDALVNAGTVDANTLYIITD